MWHASTRCSEGWGPRDYSARGLAFCREAPELVVARWGPDGKFRFMTPGTRLCLLSMLAAAAEAGVGLSVRWAFRSADDQARLIRKRLSYGARIDELLTWIAAPGYSEHHTGRALDFECLPATRPFEDTPAYDWLCRNAEEFELRLSYPANNAHGFIYEPWHWCCRREESSRDATCASDSHTFSGRDFLQCTLRYAERVPGR